MVISSSNRFYCSCNDQACEKDADESNEKSDTTSERGLHDNIAVADSQSCNKRKIEGISIW